LCVKEIDIYYFFIRVLKAQGLDRNVENQFMQCEIYTCCGDIYKGKKERKGYRWSCFLEKN